MAKKPTTEGAQVEARVLVTCALGEPDDVVSLTQDEAAVSVAAGEIDTHPDAVAYAKSLAGAQS